MTDGVVWRGLTRVRFNENKIRCFTKHELIEKGTCNTHKREPLQAVYIDKCYGGHNVSRTNKLKRRIQSSKMGKARSLVSCNAAGITGLGFATRSSGSGATSKESPR